MDIGQLREGNIIVVYPRANQEGILSVKEMQRGSIICDMVSPRPGYQFRIRFHEANPIRLSSDWLEKAAFRKDPHGAEYWVSPDNELPFRFSGETGVFGNATDHEVTYLHQLQNIYLDLTGKELQIS